MSQIQPLHKLKSSELIDRLIAIGDGRSSNELELKRIESEARKLLNGPNGQKSDGYEVLGVLAALKLQPDDVKKFFDAAINLADAESYPIRITNKAIALQKTYQLREAVVVSKKLSEAYPDSLDLLDLAYGCAITSIQLHLIRDYHQRASLLNHSLTSTRETIDTDSLSKLMEQRKVTEDDLLQRIEVAAEVLLKNRCHYIGNTFTILDTGECTYRFQTAVTPDQAAFVSFEIAEAIVEKFNEDTLADILTIACIPDERYC